MSHGTRETRTRRNSSRRLNFDFLEPRLCLSTYTTIDLIPPPGHDHSVALGLNDCGLAVGESVSLASNEKAAVVWSVDLLGSVSVARLPRIGGESSEHATEVNNQGIIAGAAWAPPVPPGGNSFVRATVWTGAFGSYHVHDLGTLGEEYVWSDASSISEPDAAGNVWVVVL